MSRLTVSDNFLSGTGVGENDAIPVGVALYKQLTSEEDINETMLVGSGITLSGLAEAYEERVNFSVAPGYVYFGDREFYMFGDKLTQVSSGVVSGDVLVVRLQEFPDGPRPIYFEDLQYPGEEEEIIYGASPIIVRRHSSGELAALQVPYDKVISSEEGLSGVIGYRMSYDIDPSGVVISGEVEDFPWYVSPLERFAKTYDPWREDLIISPDLMEYEFLTNSIIVYPSGTTLSSGEISGEYVVEFEGKNEPFSTGLDLSPLTSYPELSIVCLSPGTDNVTEDVGSIRLYSSKTRVKGDTITIIAEAFSEGGNRIADTDIDFYIERPNMTSDSTIPDPLEGEPLYYGMYHAYDQVTLPTTDIIEDGAIIASDSRVDGKAYIRAAGYLSGVPGSSGATYPVGYHLPARTDNMGFAHAVYISPSGGIFSTYDIRIVAKAGEVEAYTGITLLSETEECYLGSSQYEYNRIEYVSGVVTQDGLAYVPVISGCLSPSSITAAEADDFIVSLAADTTPLVCTVSAFDVIAGEPYVGFDLYGYTSGTPLMVSYPMVTNTTKLDGRTVYGR